MCFFIVNIKIILVSTTFTGCRITDGNVTTKNRRYITLFSYPVKNSFFSKNIRHRQSRLVLICKLL